ncbi:MAG: tyrosine--tRNA ligase [Candidatus Adiutrix sp.]|jgi:tyrosyl-tRNA synthetase|nr:tyrosine--tRNA ligase [Candidatus Adiutrix sp.]
MEKQNAYKILAERGFVYQCTDEAGLTELFDREEVTAYVGFDITADSLHIGHLLPLMALSWLDRTGHRPITLMGGGTSMIGDPSGRADSRRLLTREDISRNMAGIRPQAAKFISLFSGGRALMLDNSEWLAELNYLDFLRDIGRHFSVNRMLAAECYRQRLEHGLTFMEFNYMVMQAYDFLVLSGRQGNKLQLGGQDQWGNIVAGVELIRRVSGAEAYGATIPLLLDPKTGAKFGKTNAGAVWLDKAKTPVYDFYQFWRNVDDQQVHSLLNLFTFLPLDETARLAALPDRLLNRAKEILAYEVTALCHSPGEAAQAFLASARAFGAADPDGLVSTSSALAGLAPAGAGADLPAVELKAKDLEGATLAELFVLAGLAASKGEARRLIRQGGAYLDETPAGPDDENRPVREAAWLAAGGVTLRAGRKRYKKVVVT